MAGVALYSEGGAAALRSFAEAHGAPVAETQSARGAALGTIRCRLGSIGVTGATAANALAADADVVIAVGTRLQDFTTGSHALFGAAKLVAMSHVGGYAGAEDATGCDGGRRCRRGAAGAAGARCRGGAEAAWRERTTREDDDWREGGDRIVGRRDLPSGTPPY